jgi:hypothetical protein
MYSVTSTFTKREERLRGKKRGVLVDLGEGKVGVQFQRRTAKRLTCRVLSCGARNSEERTLCWSWDLNNKATANSVLRQLSSAILIVVSFYT